MCILYVSIWPAKTIDTEKSSAFTNHTPERNGKLPLPISKRLFEHIIQVFNLSTSFLTVLNTGLATYTSTIHDKKREDGTRLNTAREWNFLSFWGEIPLINTLEFIIQLEDRQNMYLDIWGRALISVRAVRAPTIHIAPSVWSDDGPCSGYGVASSKLQLDYQELPRIHSLYWDSYWNETIQLSTWEEEYKHPGLEEFRLDFDYPWA